MASDEGEHSVAVDIRCEGDTVERLLLTEGDTFEAEVYCEEYALEVVRIE